MLNVANTRGTWTRSAAVSALVLGMATVAPASAGAHSTRTLAAQHAVAQKNLQFNPGELMITVGDTVTWTNHETDGSTIHSVVQSGGSEINSPDIPAETSFSWTFTQVQDYNIVCRFHPDMFMTLHVMDAKATDQATAANTAKTGKAGNAPKAGKAGKAGKGKAGKAGKGKAGKAEKAEKAGKPRTAETKTPAAPPTADHDGHAASAAKSVPAPAPGAPDSTVPGVAGLPLSREGSIRPALPR